MWPNPQETADLVTFTEEVLNGKLHSSCSVSTLHCWDFSAFDSCDVLKELVRCTRLHKGKRKYCV